MVCVLFFASFTHCSSISCLLLSFFLSLFDVENSMNWCVLLFGIVLMVLWGKKKNSLVWYQNRNAYVCKHMMECVSTFFSLANESLTDCNCFNIFFFRLKFERSARSTIVQPFFVEKQRYMLALMNSFDTQKLFSMRDTFLSSCFGLVFFYYYHLFFNLYYTNTHNYDGTRIDNATEALNKIFGWDEF